MWRIIEWVHLFVWVVYRYKLIVLQNKQCNIRVFDMIKSEWVDNGVCMYVFVHLAVIGLQIVQSRVV